MIFIKRTAPPKQLTDEVVKKLTNLYKEEQSNVWSKKYIKDALLNMSHNKCCYCEAPLDQQGLYMQVEHFHPKSSYPEEVVDWDNLLPVCPTCNSKKRELDTVKVSFINPSKENPKNLFILNNYRFEPKEDNEKANRTIKVLGLNSIDKLMIARFRVGSTLLERIKKLCESVSANQNDYDLLVSNATELVGVLESVQKDKAYSATSSSLLINSGYYKKIKKVFIENSVWDEDLKKLDSEARKIAFEQV
ncbi:HNH endonuclease [Pediococcus acidilactici]|uniref:HNH endonuclease n=1 Tax=Pediococcus acidilactici TaxID=1254 RepID=UPI001896FA54|nr:HNH endonuclease [Pediococcus acidilactici]